MTTKRLTKTYSCGYILHYELKDEGTTFQCKKCNHIHSIPDSKRKKSATSSNSSLANTHSKLSVNQKFRSIIFSINSLLVEGWKRFTKLFKRTPSTLYIDGRTIDAKSGRVISVASSKIHNKENSNIFYPTAQSKKNSFTLSSDIEQLFTELQRKSWRKGEGPNKVLLSTEEVFAHNLEKSAEVMLRHAEKVAPKLNIPDSTPKIIYKTTRMDSGGTFEVDEEGYTLITIKENLQQTPLIALSVLSHELCHYILGSNEIKKTDTLENEKMTDVCMFILGFGDIFLRGIVSSKKIKYGYLERDQYFSLNAKSKYAWEDREHSDLTSKIEELEQYVIGVVFRGDKTRYLEVYSYYEKKYPEWSKTQILEKIIIDYRR